MIKRQLEPGNMLYPVPVVLVSCADKAGNTNLITIAWTGTVCSKPPMVSISLRPERHSYNMIKESGEFVINLVTASLTRATDFCGVRSGKKVDKWTRCNLTPAPANVVKAPLVDESPVNIECKVRHIKHLGSHDMIIAEVVSVSADESYFEKNNALNMDAMGLVTYLHGSYIKSGSKVGKFGYSVRKIKQKYRQASRIKRRRGHLHGK